MMPWFSWLLVKRKARSSNPRVSSGHHRAVEKRSSRGSPTVAASNAVRPAFVLPRRPTSVLILLRTGRDGNRCSTLLRQSKAPGTSPGRRRRRLASCELPQVVPRGAQAHGANDGERGCRQREPTQCGPRRAEQRPGRDEPDERASRHDGDREGKPPRRRPSRVEKCQHPAEGNGRRDGQRKREPVEPDD